MNGIQQAIEKIGLDGIAQLYTPRISPQAVHKWKESGRVPADRCPEIERATGIKCEDLNDAVSWSVLRGTKKEAA